MLAVLLACTLQLTLATPAFRNPALPWSQRTLDLVSRLTLEEKVLQLGRPKTYGRASSPPIERLGIGGYNYGVECNSGTLEGFPQNIGMAATFNRSLLFHSGRGTDRSNPMNYTGLSCWSPMINIMRHPLWGRNHEGYGECPFLSGQMAAAVVRGMQGDDDRYLLINAGCKHLAAFDGPGNGGQANISGVDWMSTYLPPFDQCLGAGALSTMCTYAKLNGTYGCQNPKLLQTYLRESLGFEGYVVSDQGAIHDPTQALNAGCDIEDGNSQYTQLSSLVRNGTIAESTIDKSVKRLFYVRMRHGEFDPSAMNPYADESKYGSAAYDHKLYSLVSLEAARQSITLLKNTKGVLPLDTHKQPNIAMFGCLVRSRRYGGRIYSDCQVAATAGYDSAAQLSGNPKKTPTPDAALRSLGFNATFVDVGFGAEGLLSAGSKQKVKDAAGTADVSVVFIGRAGSEGESGGWCKMRTCGDNTNLTLPSEQHALVTQVLSTGIPTIIVLFNTNPVDLSFLLDKVHAIVHAYYPQQWAGTAVADALAGVAAPAGRMPYSWPKDLTDAGSITDYTMAGTSKTYRFQQPNKKPPLFPFGFGLSYSRFKYSGMAISPSAAATCDNLTVSVTVANTGEIDAAEVIQVYVTWMNAPLAAPFRQLVSFERVRIPQGQKTVVRLVISAKSLALVDDSKAAGAAIPIWMAVPATMQVSVGGQQPDQVTSAPSNVLTTQISIGGPILRLDKCK